jgi:hypothetical protein
VQAKKGADKMNYLKANKDRFNLSQLEIQRFTGIPQSRISRICNMNMKEFEEKVSYKELKLFIGLFSMFRNRSETAELIELHETTTSPTSPTETT